MIKTAQSLWVTGLVGVAASVSLQAADLFVHQFEKHHLTDQFWSEGAHFADFNKDGATDIVSGPFWYEGPAFEKRHEYYPATKTSKKKSKDGKEVTFRGFSGALANRNEYSNNFLTYTGDFNKDGWPDVMRLGFPGKEAFWYENPKGAEGHWPRHMALDVTDNESPTVLDITGDGNLEIVCSSNGYYGYARPQGDPRQPWKFHRISPNNKYHKYTHGLGVGDVNGDNRLDLLEKNGWWEQPASLEGDPVWTFHKVNFGTGGAQMFAYDVNGDGNNDVITSLVAHGFGLAWFEHYKEDGQIKFRNHTFMNKEVDENKYGVHFSQLHALDLVDMDGDGLKDIITGKRFWAHGPTGDPEPNAPAVLYWFRLVRLPGGAVDFVPYLIDDDSGVGTQVEAADINGDGLPDIVVGNKKGTFVHRHSKQKVDRQAYLKAQPKPVQK